jgi:hypothetical protein
LRGFASDPDKTAFHDLAMIFLSCTFIMVDYFYILWIFSLRYKFPKFLGTAIMKGFLGAVESIHKSLGDHISRSQNEADRRMSGE